MCTGTIDPVAEMKRLQNLLEEEEELNKELTAKCRELEKERDTALADRANYEKDYKAMRDKFFDLDRRNDELRRDSNKFKAQRDAVIYAARAVVLGVTE